MRANLNSSPGTVDYKAAKKLEATDAIRHRPYRRNFLLRRVVFG